MKSLTGGQSTAKYCSDLCNYDGDPLVLDCPQIPDEVLHPTLREEVEAAVKALKIRKSAGVDNIPRRRRSHDRHPDLSLQQDLEDRRMADHMDS